MIGTVEDRVVREGRGIYEIRFFILFIFYVKDIFFL